MYQALNVIVKGRVQGVGFRPYVFALAKKYNIKGTVQNNYESVSITIEGEEEILHKMVHELTMKPPKLSKITDIKMQQTPLGNYQDFTILPSKEDEQKSTITITQDAAICEHCLEEMNDPHNRRYQYPFINCTQCGPRYTIIHRFPYDRPTTTMANFPMCPYCQNEYDDPHNRRHHAQPICCFECGPTLKLLNSNGEQLAHNLQAIAKTRELLKLGKIIALKGIGGYHLVCDANKENVIDRLREGKKRPQKPLAIMVKSLEVAKKYFHLSLAEEDLLTNTAMPIVLLQRRYQNSFPENIAPGLTKVGIMLPYTPIHHLLFEGLDLESLVMTSANTSGFPIVYKSSEHKYLSELCDFVLTHNREIAHPIEDSVVEHNGINTVFIRRARGFAPEVMKSKVDVSNIIAFGGNQKNAFAIGSKKDIVLSSQLGDLDNEEMIHRFNDHIQSYKDWYDVNEHSIAVDKHPLYATNMLAKQTNSKIFQIQHHHAHHVSCMVEHNLYEPCLGIILDGTGYGEDGHIWGFEFLYGDAQKFLRAGHLQYTPLPGGEKAVKEPWRNAVGMLISTLKNEGKEYANKLFPEKLNEIQIIDQMILKQLNTPMAGTCGRLFDAVSAILGICTVSTYEGEAAIKLSDYMNLTVNEPSASNYPFHINVNTKNELELDMSPMIRQITIDRLDQKPVTEIIHKFHQTIVESCVQTIEMAILKHHNLNRNIVLSGGSFQNNYLSIEIKNRFQELGFQVFTHQALPCHDGGLAIGQLMIAAHKIAANSR